MEEGTLGCSVTWQCRNRGRRQCGSSVETLKEDEARGSTKLEAWTEG